MPYAGPTTSVRSRAIVVPSAPIVSLGVSYLVLGEHVSLREACGFALAAAGVLTFALNPSVVTRRE